MALACKCDRCGKLFEGKCNTLLELLNMDKYVDNVLISTRYIETGDIYKTLYSVDLCTECCSELISWIKGYKDDKKEESK